MKEAADRKHLWSCDPEGAGVHFSKSNFISELAVVLLLKQFWGPSRWENIPWETGFP